MIQYFKKNNGKLIELQRPEPCCWINISPPFSSDELESFAEQNELPIDFLTDPLDLDEQARFEMEEDIRLIVVNSPILNEGYRDDEAMYITIPIGIILLPENVVTISPFENTILQSFLDNKVKNFKPEDESLFVLQIFEQNIYRFLNCLKKLNLKRNLVEKELSESSRNQDLRQLLSIQKSLVYFVNSLNANELLKMKIKRSDILKIRGEEEKQEILDDVIVDNSQAMGMANIHTNIINITMTTYSSIISNNLSVIMQRLTLITIILMVPTLVASFFGMNVPVPLGTSGYAFMIIFIFSFFVSLFLAYFFRRKRLL